MHQITNREYEEYQKYRQAKNSGKILTPDGLRSICEAYGYDPTKIGQHFLELLPTIAPPPVPVEEETASCIGDLEVTVRAYNSLMRAGIRELDQLLGCTQAEIAELPGMGKVAMKSIQDGLERFGLSFKSAK